MARLRPARALDGHSPTRRWGVRLRGVLPNGSPARRSLSRIVDDRATPDHAEIGARGACDARARAERRDAEGRRPGEHRRHHAGLPRAGTDAAGAVGMAPLRPRPERRLSPSARVVAPFRPRPRRSDRRPDRGRALRPERGLLYAGDASVAVRDARRLGEGAPVAPGRARRRHRARASAGRPGAYAARATHACGIAVMSA